MKELDIYVSENVPALTGGAQHPTTMTSGSYINFNMAHSRALIKSSWAWGYCARKILVPPGGSIRLVVLLLKLC